MTDAELATRRGNTKKEADASRGDATRQHIKMTARRLFATQGLGAVSIRQIVDASGQKNAGAVNYYFQSKDALIRELILDVGTLLESERDQLVDQLEASGKPITVRDILTILIHVPTPRSKGVAKKASYDEHAYRFLTMVMMNHRDLLFDALKGGADRGSRRCLAHLRSFYSHLPPAILQQRLMFLVLDLFAICSSREAAREHPQAWRSLWGQPAARENVLDTLVGILSAPISAETLASMDGQKNTRVARIARASQKKKAG